MIILSLFCVFIFFFLYHAYYVIKILFLLMNWFWILFLSISSFFLFGCFLIICVVWRIYNRKLATLGEIYEFSIFLDHDNSTLVIESVVRFFKSSILVLDSFCVILFSLLPLSLESFLLTINEVVLNITFSRFRICFSFLSLRNLSVIEGSCFSNGSSTNLSAISSLFFVSSLVAGLEDG